MTFGVEIGCAPETHTCGHMHSIPHIHITVALFTHPPAHTHTSIQREREAHKHIHTYKTHTQRKYTALDRLKTSWLQDSSTIRFSSVCCIPVWWCKEHSHFFSVYSDSRHMHPCRMDPIVSLIRLKLKCYLQEFTEPLRHLKMWSARIQIPSKSFELCDLPRIQIPSKSFELCDLPRIQIP